MKRRDLERHLRAHGCRLDHHGGGHDIWFNPQTQRQAPVPRHAEINTFTAIDICKQLGVPRPAGR